MKTYKIPGMTKLMTTRKTSDRIIDALFAIAAERGLDEVSIREVAAGAGVSIGSVQYYCRSKDEMLVMAFERVVTQITDRSQNVAPGNSVGARMHSWLSELLPLHTVSTAESRVYLAFLARAVVVPQLGHVLHRTLNSLRSHCADALRHAQHIGEAPTDFDPELAAASTVVLIDGLLLHLLTDPTGLSRKKAVAILDAHLRQWVKVDAE